MKENDFPLFCQSIHSYIFPLHTATALLMLKTEFNQAETYTTLPLSTAIVLVSFSKEKNYTLVLMTFPKNRIIKSGFSSTVYKTRSPDKPIQNECDDCA